MFCIIYIFVTAVYYTLPHLTQKMIPKFPNYNISVRKSYKKMNEKDGKEVHLEISRKNKIKMYIISVFVSTL